MCDTISFKPFHAWAQNVSTKNLTEEFTKMTKITEWCKVIKKAGPSKCKDVVGTYIHPDLVHSVITWAAPMQALCVNQIMHAITVCNNAPNYVPHITNKDTLEMIDDKASVAPVIDKCTNVAVYAKCVDKEGGSVKKERQHTDYQYIIASSNDLVKLVKNHSYKKKYPCMKCVCF